ncbi:MAG TPA: nuclear transport factor 2 family protein [Streptosporangiaceae bacterium]|jgi:ketosteroid isomerase-like protein
MSEQNESLVRTAYAAFSQGDVATMLELVHPDLEWTFLDPAFENPDPRTCLGREQLQQVMERRGGLSPQADVEEIDSAGDKVMVVVHTPGLDQQRARQAEDRNYMVVTVRQGQITVLRACRDRDEARRLTGLS